MVEPISVEAPSEAAAQQLAGSLAARFPLEVSQVDGAWLVVVTPGGPSERLVTEVLDVVERWLVDAGVAGTRVRLDGHVYGMERPGLVEG
jgi:hypothetical protein